MRRVLIAATALALLSAPAMAQAPTGAYAVDKTHSSIMWKGLHQGLSWYVARFTNFDITVEFNEADVSKSKVTATIDPKSIETDYARTRPANRNDDFNNELATGDRFFNAGKFPQIAFKSTAISKTGEKTGKMTGDLTFLGVTKPVTLDVTYVGNRADARTQKHKIGFAATGSIKKTDFGMAAGGSIADDVKIEINAELIQK